MRKGSSSTQIPMGPRNIRGISPLVEQLGTPRAIYEPAKPPFLARILGPFCILLGALILCSFLFTYKELLNWWPLWEAAIVPIIGITWVMAGLWFTLTPLIHSRARVVICPKGLIYITRRAEAIPWNKIEELWKDVRTDSKLGIIRSYRVLRADGTTFALKNDLPSVEKLGRLLEREVTRHLLPGTITAYNNGTRIVFDEIAVSTQGIAVKQKRASLLWSDVEYITIDETSVSIYKKGEYWDWSTVPVARIPNVAVLKGLVDFVMGQRDSSPLFHMIAAYNAGFSVIFGNISISKQGVDMNNGKSTLSWSEIAGIGVGEREVIIRRRSRIEEWYALPIWMIPDASLLKDLVDYIMQGKP